MARWHEAGGGVTSFASFLAGTPGWARDHPELHARVAEEVRRRVGAAETP